MANDSTLLDLSSPTPLYKQLAGILRNSINVKEYANDTKIPTEAELMLKYNVSRITVRKALEELTDEGLLVRKQGKGTFVSTSQTIQQNYPFMPFNEAASMAQKTPSTKLLSYSLEFPSSKIARFLRVPENDQVIVVKRLRYADKEPIILETSYFLKSFDFLSDEPLNGSTSEILSKHNIHAIHGKTSISICYSTEAESSLFGIVEDTPLLYVYSEIQDQNMAPIQVSKQVIRSNFYKLILEK